MSGVVQVALAIVTLGMIATVVVNGGNTARVITAASNGFAGSLGAAEKG